MPDFLTNIFDWLNANSGSVQALSTIFLVGVTIWYAKSTKEMSDVMRKQVTSKMIIENISIGSQFLSDWFPDREYSSSSPSRIEIKVVFDVRNEGNASGSIFKPNLLISSDDSDEVFSLNPITVERKQTNRRKEGIMTHWDIEETRHGSVIFVQGGEAKKKELTYRFEIENDKQVDFVNEIQSAPESVTYRIKTKDNLAKEYNIKVMGIEPERDFGIK